MRQTRRISLAFLTFAIFAIAFPLVGYVAVYFFVVEIGGYCGGIRGNFLPSYGRAEMFDGFFSPIHHADRTWIRPNYWTLELSDREDVFARMGGGISTVHVSDFDEGE